VQSREDELLVMLLDPANQKATQIQLARRLGWKMSNGDPYHVLVQRILKALEKAKLVTIERGQTILTKKGKTAAESCLKKHVQTDPHGTDFVQA
jgi:Mn-dependent DtxR family transcriptional regulator